MAGFSFSASARPRSSLSPAEQDAAPESTPAQAPTVTLSPADTGAPANVLNVGGSGDPGLDEYLNYHGNLLGGPRHPVAGFFMGGQFKNKTPGQMREVLAEEYRSGRRRPMGTGGGTLKTPTMTGGNPFTPTDEWQRMTQPGQIAKPISTATPGAMSAKASSMNPAVATPAAPAKAPAQAPRVSSPALAGEPQTRQIGDAKWITGKYGKGFATGVPLAPHQTV